jgi:hypothetical protein
METKLSYTSQRAMPAPNNRHPLSRAKTLPVTPFQVELLESSLLGSGVPSDANAGLGPSGLAIFNQA